MRKISIEKRFSHDIAQFGNILDEMPIEGCMVIEQVFDFMLGGNLNLMRNVILRLWHFWKGKQEMQ